MNNYDSFNDSDEIISLYSSKKVKETFKTQLQKIVSNSHGSNVNQEIESKEKNSKNNDAPFKEENSAVNVPESDVLSVTSSTPKRPLDDSIEIITELSPGRRTRQSERLRRKKEGRIIEINLSCESPSKKHLKNSSRKGKKNGKPKKVLIDVVDLDEHIESNDAEEEDLNPEVSVKVIWKSVNVKKFQMRKFQKFSKIFDLLSHEENIPEDKIMLTFNNVKVCRNDTPDSLNLQVYHFLDGGVLSELTNSHESNSSLVDNSDKINLKFQDFNKKIVKVKMDKRDKMKVGMLKCSEQLEIPLEKIKFYFDGELLEPSETPENLGLDSDEIIDIKIFD